VKHCFLSIGLALACCQGLSAQFIDHQGYPIRYTALPSSLIPGDVAAAHGIVRAENRILLNVSALLDDEPSSAVISGQVVNLLNQRFTLAFNEVREAQAIYYLAGHTALPRDILRFELQVDLPEATPVTIRFLRRYD